ncbi:MULTISPECIES: anti-sigma F factor [unclassified Pelosinus]|uniref:anti-sigma F factor n=1 Tax=unclassified Pelosinus TaxID=2629460 RepID=UPI0004D1BE1C|nr:MULTISPECIES: anti-sigma F factor [unclassified Pelosinus]AIF51521.1 anti-sigma regulatory factor, serine/threonine protein kinase [Pelosinus sp. UFO1]GMA99209.1 anti-sigma F factor [Pelosinus sp. IPA-1]
MAIKNQITMSIQSLSENVGIARVSAAAFAAQIDFTLNEIEEIKVAVSEAVSNAVIHGYEYQNGEIEIRMTLYNDKLEYIIIDHGKGITDIDLARQPSYSTDPERMGLGFAFMESFMDELAITSEVNKGTEVRMVKKTLLKTEH